MVSTMRVLSSPSVVENADKVVRVIIETYLSRNKSFGEVTEILDNESMNPLRDFSNACREDLEIA
jgi:Tfp pilus assembly protein PilP